ncbi:MAG: glutamine--fructose-6-phosphate transaminase (isomerizing) [Alphaproteobacteria bacterium]|nr:glutamine--fructose-6-phosphate transaminase (isomerizing) [Alphaproteobacteria bacterium]
MCGIIGILGDRPAAPLLLEGLKRLEYRGYDSAGIATLVNGHIERRRAKGKIARLAAILDAEPLPGTVGIGHTRWATHGVPNEANAHPHMTQQVALVHNGIIENFAELRDELTALGCNFESDTDTEAVAHLVTHNMRRGMGPEAAVAATLKRLHGAFAFAMIFAGHHEMMIGARRGAALAVGYGEEAMYLGSDALALAPLTRRIAYLEEGDWVVVRRDGTEVFDAEDRPVVREIRETALSGALVGKGNHHHYMQKEIFEQPTAIGDTLQSFLNPATRSVHLPALPFDLAAVPKATIVACGTSFYAGLIAKYWIERVARLPVEIDIASEFRYRAADMPEGGLALFISQSGETIDTLAALRYARTQHQHVAAIVNVPESTMAREADVVLRTVAGPEIAVASTKGFTSQLVVLASLTLALARARGKLDAAAEAALALALADVPSAAAAVLAEDATFRALAAHIAKARDVLYLGRGTAYPIAMEGALKLKELSYIHAEGYAAGEMKHGPIALIDDAVPIVVIAPPDEMFEKTASNLQEALARGGRVIMISDQAGVDRFAGRLEGAAVMPRVHPMMTPILYALPVQLLAYHVAVLKGTDVDQPRNLAKSVVVE